MSLAFLLVPSIPVSAQVTTTSGTSFSFNYIPITIADSYYAVGRLVWTDQGGSVAWTGATASTADPSPPPTSDQPSALGPAADAQLGWTLRSNTGGEYGRERIPWIEFSSQPLPSKVFINASHVIHIDLYHTECSWFPETEVRVGEKLLGGLIDGPGFNPFWGGPNPVPPPAAGYCVRAIRFHPEMDVLEEGNVLKVRFFFHRTSTSSTNTPPQVGLKAPHATVIKIPFYPPADAVLRRPEFATQGGPSWADGASEGEVPAGTMSWLALASPSLGLAFVLGRAGSPRRAWTAAFILLASLGGCLKDSGPADPASALGGTKTETYLKTDDSPLSDAGRGSIVGTVFNDVGTPLARAHVSLIGTDGFADTDNIGRFVFTNLTPGAYQLRVERAGYVTFEDQVAVKAGSVTRVSIAMEPREKKANFLREHRHDSWPASGKKTIFSQPLAFGSGQITICQGSGMCMLEFGLAPDPSEPNLVLPGTTRLEASIHWPEENVVDRVGLMFQSNHPGQNDKSRYNWSYLYPRGNGESFSVPLTWEMTDAGHQQFSTFQFAIYIPLNSRSSGAGSAILRAPFDVKMEIVKGVLPLEPGHRVFWGQEHVLRIIEVVPGSSWKPGKLVPPGTASLEIWLNQTRDTQQDWTVTYHPANVPPASTSTYVDLAPESRTETSSHYVYPLAPAEADSFYARQSNWAFARRIPAPDTTKGYQDSIDSNVNGAPVFSLTVLAHKDPAYVDGEQP